MYNIFKPVYPDDPMLEEKRPLGLHSLYSGDKELEIIDGHPVMRDAKK
jgi:hypothetical protein